MIQKELSDACKVSLSVANSIYTEFVEGISKWWKECGNVPLVSKNSELWQDVEKHLITEIN
jgi:hypothetical protein